MDKPIQVGDLVVVTKPTPCCGRDDAVGRIFPVIEIETTSYKCLFCDRERKAVIGWMNWVRGCDLYRVKRIPPLEELESLDYEHKLDVRA